MAVIWQKQVGENRYEVRSAGASVRLYSNGVFHSQYNPRQTISNSIWDLFLLPTFFCDPGEIKRILILGVGGGAVIKMLHHYTNPEEIVGIELDPIHLKVAKQFFHVNKRQAELICDDAVHWLKHYSGPAFDLIIDDLFGHENGEISRAVNLSGQWINCLTKNCSRNGLIVVNTVELSDIRQSGFVTNKKVRQSYPFAFKMTHPSCENRVFVFTKRDISIRKLKQNVMNIPHSRVKSSLFKLALRVRRFQV